MSRPSGKILFAAFVSLFLVEASATPSLLSAQEDEVEAEWRSTVPTDPEYRKRKASPPRKEAAETHAAAETSPAAPTPSAGAEGEEGNEWKTMTSERRRRTAPAIKIDLEKKKILTGKISFVSNGDQPTADSLGILKQLAKELNKKAELSIRIEGHADSVGSDEKNRKISERRADRVKEVLVREGVAAERLQAVGMGDAHPIASDTTPAGQEQNRRVEFHILETPPPAPSAETPPPAPMPTLPSTPSPSPETSPIPPPPVPAPMLMPTPPPAPLPSAPISPPLPPISTGASTQPVFPETSPSPTLPVIPTPSTPPATP